MWLQRVQSLCFPEAAQRYLEESSSMDSCWENTKCQHKGCLLRSQPDSQVMEKEMYQED